jgi:hypothetical protein
MIAVNKKYSETTDKRTRNLLKKPAKGGIPAIEKITKVNP